MKILKFLVLFIALISISLSGNTQIPGLQWAKAMDGDEYSQGQSIATDLSGNVYTAGTFGGTVDFDPGSGVHNVTSATEQDGFIVKLDANGNFVWLKTMGGGVTSIALDADGNIYATGWFFYDTSFGSFPLINKGHTDIFITKLDEDGDFIWANAVGDLEYDEGYSIAIDGAGSVYVTGAYQSVVDFGIATLSSTLNPDDDSPSRDVFVTRLNASGNFIWAKSMGGGYEDNGTSVAIDLSSIHITGTYVQPLGEEVDFNPGSGKSLLTSDGDINIFICTLDDEGDFVWAKQLGGPEDDYANSIATDASGNVYTTGRFSGTADFDPGTGTFELIQTGNPEDIFVSKLDATGNFVWAKSFNGTDSDSNGVGYSITTNTSGDVYVAGYFAGTVDFDPSTGTSYLISNPGTIFICKLTSAGNYVWADRFGGQAYNQASSIVTDDTGNVYVTGYYGDSNGDPVDFAPGACDFDLPAPAADYAIFVQKIGTVPSGCFGLVIQPVSQTTCVGSTISFTAIADGTTNITYRWQVIDDSGMGYVDIADGGRYSGTGTSTFTITNVIPGDGSAYKTYRCKVKGDSFADLFSDEVNLEVIAAPSIVNIVRCGPGVVTLKASGGAEGQYLWYTTASGGVPIDGEINETYTTPALTTSTTYYVSIKLTTCETARVAVTASINSCAPIPELVWAKSFGGNGYALSMFTDTNGNTFTTGFFRGSADFDPSAGVTTLNSTGGNEVFISKLDAAGNLVWAKSVGGNSDEQGNSITVDVNGNVYVTGIFRSTGDFDPGTPSVPLTSNGGYDVFILKLDANGNFVWVQQIGNGLTVGDISSTILTDASGNVYTLGNFLGTTDFNPGDGTFTLTSSGQSDAFISKLDGNGNFVSALKFGGTDYDVPANMIIDSFGSLYISGYFRGTSDFDPGTGTFNLTSAGNDDVFVSKLDASGNLVWAKSAGGTGRDQSNNLVRDAFGNIAVTGRYEGTADFDPSTSTFALTSLGNDEAFVLKLNSSGNFVWAKSMGAADDDTGNRITSDADGNIYTTGTFNKTVDFDPGATTFSISSAGLSDIFATKLNANGEFVWAISMGGLGSDFPMGINLDANRNIFINGAMNKPGDVDPGPNTFTVTPIGSFGTFVEKLGEPAPVIIVTTQPAAATVCSGSNASLSIVAVGANGLTYQWQKLNTTTSLFENLTNTGGYSGTTTVTLTINTTGNFGNGQYRCRVSGTSASDVLSNNATVTVNNVPAAPSVTPASLCSAGIATLTATGASNGQYRWYTTSTGTAIVGETNNSFTTPSLTSTTTYYASIDNGTCESARVVVTATINTPPSAPIVISGANCGSGSVTLKASGGTAGEYRWYNVATGGAFITGEINSNYTTPSLATTTTYYVAINNGACESNRTSVIATINTPPAKPAITSTQTITGGTIGVCLTLATLNAPTGYTSYLWSAGQTTQQITPGPGKYSVVVVDNNGCSSPLSDEVQIIVLASCINSAPVINPDPITTAVESSVDINLLSMISDPDNNLNASTLKIINQPTSGAVATLDANGILRIDYKNISFTGSDHVTIEVCDLLGVCTQESFSIEVIGDINVYNGISPNGDGKNEILFLQYIELQEATRNNTVTIFNRWGDQMWEGKDYNNTSVVFNGTNKNGSEVPSGTYFYRIKFENGQTTKTGFFIIER